MKALLTLKHWELFLILASSSIISIIIHNSSITLGNFNNSDLSIIIRVVGIIIYFLWILTLGIGLTKKYNPDYVLIKELFIPSVIICMLGYSYLTLETLLETKYTLPVVLHLLLIISIFSGLFYTFYSLSKTLKSIELQRNVRFSECYLQAFLLFFFPIGVWLLQPKISKLFK